MLLAGVLMLAALQTTPPVVTASQAFGVDYLDADFTSAQERRRKIRRVLKEVDAEIRSAKKNLRVMASAKNDPFDQAPPLRMFGETKTGSE